MNLIIFCQGKRVDAKEKEQPLTRSKALSTKLNELFQQLIMI